ncbi:DNA recombination protein RecN [Bacillus coahuilensis m2-6]|uniref:DNA repair protein RecN n=1 Tax=Bacillus coahuilensis TaxID=408580 RepID=UPI00075051AF|nr:DNA repair protein RecN [Bacillus coahuilensis]KUP07353.1 DNA recombination protein RecN [Bacillus coahuilensis m2-6]
MLQELSIRNFAIIESLNLSIEEGLTVLSGETGAGKSIIIDAIHLLVGGRGSAEFVRHGEKKAEIEGLFYLDRQDHPCYQKAEVVGVEIEDDMLILRREISASGKSVCRINGKLVTISTLREIGSTLVDIHGQHEHQELMDERFHLLLLDQFGGNEIISALSNYQEIYTVYDQTKNHLDKLNDNEQKTAHRLDLIQFQLSEIEKAELRLHEDEELMEEKRKLNNFEKLYEALNSAYESIQGEQKALDWTGLAMSHMESVSDIDEELNTVLDSVSSSYYALEDASRTIRYQLDGLEYNPERLHEIEDRLNEINSLKRKYGTSIEEILEYSARIEEEIDQITNRDTHILELQNKLASFEKDLEIEANNLTDVRKKVATELTNSIHDQLQELYMAKTVFQVRFDQIQRSFGKNGQDVIEFYISTNPGEPLKPLSKVASGGELSRIMLALKTIFSKHQGITSIIFDEVDTGVSGRVAQAIAEKIYTVATNSQVLCISHLPQVAAMADTHLYISKITENERTSTKVNVLTKDEKITEIGRMISGVEITELTKDHAKELLEIANKMKKAYT